MEITTKTKSEANATQRAMRAAGIPQSAITIVKNDDGSSTITVLKKYNREYAKAKQQLLLATKDSADDDSSALSS